MVALCDRPPRGWHCYLRAGHDGPCPAWPSSAFPWLCRLLGHRGHPDFAGITWHCLRRGCPVAGEY